MEREAADGAEPSQPVSIDREGGASPVAYGPDRCFDVWLASRFQVEAASPDEATRRAREWLVTRIQPAPPADVFGRPEEYAVASGADTDPASGGKPFAPAVLVTRPALPLQDATVLALLLLTLERRGGEAAARVERLRQEVMEEEAAARPSAG